MIFLQKILYYFKWVFEKTIPVELGLCPLLLPQRAPWSKAKAVWWHPIILVMTTRFLLWLKKKPARNVIAFDSKEWDIFYLCSIFLQNFGYYLKRVFEKRIPVELGLCPLLLPQRAPWSKANAVWWHPIILVRTTRFLLWPKKMRPETWLYLIAKSGVFFTSNAAQCRCWLKQGFTLQEHSVSSM